MDEEKTYTITLADGRELTGLHFSGNSFVSDAPLNKEVFQNALSRVKIYDGVETTVRENMGVYGPQETDGRWYFVLYDLSEQELRYRKINADIQYLSMMTGNDLD